MERKETEHDIFPIIGISSLKLRDLGYIVYRNLFLLTNGIIFSVVLLLFIFGDFQAGLFLGIVAVINVVAGLAQDINAWLALEKLQLLTAPRVLRLNIDGSEESVFTQDIAVGDRIRLKTGDQVPSDSMLIESNSLEINEGLITGESDSFPRDIGDRLLGGSVITSGSGVIKIEKAFTESRITRMTEGIKRYSVNLSPIQRSVDMVVVRAGYVLVAVIIFIVVRGSLQHVSAIRIVKDIGALTSMLVPVGLMFTITLFFAYGAAHLYRRKVLLQEVNATEKLGRIKNLCMDKTGTLTENVLTVESMFIPEGIDNAVAVELVAAYIHGTGDVSQMGCAIGRYLDRPYLGMIKGVLNFSSWRGYGAVRAIKAGQECLVLVGAPDIFLPYLEKSTERAWLQDLIETYSHQGKRLVCVARSTQTSLPRTLEGIRLSIITVFVFSNNLREGIRSAVDFFQDRGVFIRIISGDNPATVSHIAASAGVRNADRVVTGKEMMAWTDYDFDNKTKEYVIFARIIPEQKEKIIEALKKDGFTAMIGDGANDALAIKKADLGIAMFDGASATRQLASVVLMNNSFAALPDGVRLADNIIKNIEIFSSIFFNITFVGFFLFLFTGISGTGYPLTPLNITLINYFTVGIPGLLISYWAIRPSGRVQPATSVPFLKKILPFAMTSSIFQAAALIAVLVLSSTEARAAESNIFVLLTLIIVGYAFFSFAPSVYRGIVTRAQKIQILALAALETLILITVLKSPPLLIFFDVTELPVSSADMVRLFLIIIGALLAQFGLASLFRKNKKHQNLPA